MENKTITNKKLYDDIIILESHVNNLSKAIKGIKEGLKYKKMVTERNYKFCCPYCKGHDLRVNLNDAFCRAWGEPL